MNSISPCEMVLPLVQLLLSCLCNFSLVLYAKQANGGVLEAIYGDSWAWSKDSCTCSQFQDDWDVWEKNYMGMYVRGVLYIWRKNCSWFVHTQISTPTVNIHFYTFGPRCQDFWNFNSFSEKLELIHTKDHNVWINSTVGQCRPNVAVGNELSLNSPDNVSMSLSKKLWISPLNLRGSLEE